MSTTAHELLDPSRDDEAGPPPLSPQERASALRVLATIAVAYVGTSMVFTLPLSLSLALSLERIAPAQSTSQLSAMITVGTLFGIFMLMAVGRLSDSTTSRLGRRRPWLIGSMAGVVVGAVLLSTAGTLPLLWAGFLVTATSAATGISSLYSIVADQVPPQLQGTASGVMGAVTVLGSILGLFIAQTAPSQATVLFAVPAAVSVVPMLVLTVTLHDPRREEPSDLSWRVLVECFTFDVRRFQSFAWLMPATILAFSLVNGVQAYAYYLAERIVGEDLAAVARAVLVALVLLNVIAFAVSLVVGRIGDRQGHVKLLFCASTVVSAVGGAIVALATSLPVFYTGFAVAGVAMGLAITTYLTLAMKTIVGSPNPGRDLNIAASSATISSGVVSLVAPLALGSGSSDFTRLMIVMIVMTLAALVFMPKVKL